MSAENTRGHSNCESIEGVLPTIGITMGDAAGIGPEVILKTLNDPDLMTYCLPVIIGDAAFLHRTEKELGFQLDLAEVPYGEKIPRSINSPIIYDLDNLKEDFSIGVESAIAGRASGEYIETAVDLWKNGEIDAIATAPINKKSLEMGGFDFVGHTEFLAELTNTKDFAMSFFAKKLCVVLLSTHVSLRDAIDLVKKEKLIKLIRFTDE